MYAHRTRTALQTEAERLVGKATFTRKDLNPYLETPSQAVPEDHPRPRFRPRTHGMVRGDRFAGDDVT